MNSTQERAESVRKSEKMVDKRIEGRIFFFLSTNKGRFTIDNRNFSSRYFVVKLFSDFYNTIILFSRNGIHYTLIDNLSSCSYMILIFSFPLSHWLEFQDSWADVSKKNFAFNLKVTFSTSFFNILREFYSKRKPLQSGITLKTIFTIYLLAVKNRNEETPTEKLS